MPAWGQGKLITGDSQGGHAKQPDLLPSSRSPVPWTALCLATIVCPW